MEYIHQNYHNILLEEQKRIEERKRRCEEKFDQKKDENMKILEKKMEELDLKKKAQKAMKKSAEKIIAVLRRILERRKRYLDRCYLQFEEDCKAVRDLLLQNPDPIGQKIFLDQPDMGGVILDMGELATVLEKVVEEAGKVKYLYILGPKSKGENDDFDIDAFEEQYL